MQTKTITVDATKVTFRVDPARFERKRAVIGDARALRDLIRSVEFPKGDERQDRVPLRQQLAETVAGDPKLLADLFPPKKAPAAKAGPPKPAPAPTPAKGEKGKSSG